MKALVIQNQHTLEIVEKPRPEPASGQVLVKILAAALNKRDQFIKEGKYPGIVPGATLGSDGVGKVIALGAGVPDSLLNKRVVINPNREWGTNEKVQGRDYNILGMPSDGTFAEYIAVDADRVHEAPDHLNNAGAAALPLAGLTAYRACFYHGKITPGNQVLISGFGGGVAQFAFQFALAAGANVYVTSGSEEKLQRATDMGAAGGFNYKDADWWKRLPETLKGFDVVIDSAGGNQINDFIRIMNPGGRIIFYGATNGLPSSLDLYRMFWNQIALQGSTMGSDQEFSKMLSFVSDNNIEPVIDLEYSFDEMERAFDAIKDATGAGKIIVNM